MTKQASGSASAAGGDPGFEVEARFCQRREDGSVACQLCPRGCVIAAGARGHCGVRENREGSLISLVYARASAAHIDPIEKKPLFHFLPGSTALSLGTAGCNVTCKFCQNAELAHALPEVLEAELLAPAQVAELASQAGCASVAFTYNEPTVFAEYAMDTADAAHAAGVRSVAISNGYIHAVALEAVYGRMDAVKIDLKSFSEGFYRDVVGARLRPVLDSLLALRRLGKWLEIVCLVIPTLNDGDEELSAMAAWIHEHLGPDVPLHFSRYYPHYLLKELPATPVATLERAKAIAEAAGLHYVYLGNVPGHAGQHTHCPKCRRMLVERAGYEVRRMMVREGRCPYCQQAIAGVWQE